MTERALLVLEELAVQFETRLGVVSAVEGVSLQIHPGETLAVVGESGSGKSVAAMAILGLTQSQGGRVTRGRIVFDGQDLLGLTQDQMRSIRGNDIAMVFQEPMTCLNPVFSVGNQVTEVLELHRHLSRSAARQEALRLFELVGIPSPEQRLDEYPHQLSGGMRQRVMIAMALSCNPKLLIADEPTTALDVTVQAQILDLLRELQQRLGMAILLITHDLGVVASMAQRVNVMYAGRVVESANVFDIFERPRHPYTVGLLESLPKMHAHFSALRPIEGNVPDALSLPTGCRFHPRCPFRFAPCDTEQPEFIVRGNHGSACHYTALHPSAALLTESRQRFEASTSAAVRVSESDAPEVPSD